MKYEIGQKEYTFNCKLRTCVKIKQQFKKNYNQIIEELDKLDVMDMIKLLYCGLDSNEVSEEDFRNNLLDNCGMGEMYEILTWFIKQLQYPGLSEEEIEKKLEEKKQKKSE